MQTKFVPFHDRQNWPGLKKQQPHAPKYGNRTRTEYTSRLIFHRNRSWPFFQVGVGSPQIVRDLGVRGLCRVLVQLLNGFLRTMSRRDPALDDISVLNDPNWTPPTANDIVSHPLLLLSLLLRRRRRPTVAVRVLLFHPFAVFANTVC